MSGRKGRVVNEIFWKKKVDQFNKFFFIEGDNWEWKSPYQCYHFLVVCGVRSNLKSQWSTDEFESVVKGFEMLLINIYTATSVLIICASLWFEVTPNTTDD